MKVLPGYMKAGRRKEDAMENTTVTSKERSFFRENAGEEYERIYKICETAVEFARMWGIMETLDSDERLSGKNFQERTGTIISWAEEFVTSREDMLVFLQKKMKEMSDNK